MKIKNEPYKLMKVNPNRYEFFSEGVKGKIRKVVEYSWIRSLSGYYVNLGFGDYNELTGRIDDRVITSNGDTNKVLATVVDSIVDFMKSHPNETIYAKGSTPARTRLYRIGIAQILEEINMSFKLQGFINGKWEVFQKGKNYTAFMLKDKKII